MVGSMTESTGRSQIQWGRGRIAYGQIPEWLIDSKVSHRAIRLYLLLSIYAGKNGDSFPGGETLRKRLRCARSTLTGTLDELVAAGALEIEARYRENGGRTSNLYTLHWAPPPAAGAVGPPAAGAVGKELTPEGTKEVDANASTSPLRRNGVPNPVWDVVSEIWGEPLPNERSRIARGRIIADLRELLKRDGIRDAEQAKEQVRVRHAALAREWGWGKATARSLVNNWVTAGALLNGGGKRGLTPEEMARQAIEAHNRGE